LPQNHFGSGILFNEYEDWKRIRNIIKKSFADSYLKKMTYIIEESIEQLIQTLNPIAMNSEMTDLVKHLSAFNLNITLRTFFGVNLEKLSPKIYENATKISNPKITIEKLFALLFPNISNAIGIDFTDKKATNFLIDLTKDIINKIKGTETERNDMLRFMLRANNKSKKFF
jgi:cytochrome P450